VVYIVRRKFRNRWLCTLVREILAHRAAPRLRFRPAERGTRFVSDHVAFPRSFRRSILISRGPNRVSLYRLVSSGSRLLLHHGLHYGGGLRRTSAALYADARPAFSLRSTNARTLLKKDSISRVQSPRSPPPYFTRHFCFPRRKPFLGIHRPCINRSSEHRRGEIAQRRRRS